MPSLTNTSRAYDFSQTLGVNIHSAWKNSDSSYRDASITQRSLSYLGVTHVRDGVPYENFTLSDYIALAQNGIKFNILVTSPNLETSLDLGRIGRLESAVPGSVASIEGVNEFNTNDVYLDGQGSRNNPAWVQLYGPRLYDAVKSTPGLGNIEIIAPSLASSGAYDVARQGNVSGFSDSANWHTYFGQGDQPYNQTATNLALARSSSPGEKVTTTESGYYTAVDAYDWGGGGVTPAIQAILSVNILLDGFKLGAERTYIYELLDNIAYPSSYDLSNSFGLFLADGTPKPAANAIHNLTTILDDRGGNAGGFGTSNLNLSVNGLPDSATTMTLQKSDGTFEVVVWDEPDIWNQPARSAIDPGTRPVTVNLGGTYSTVRIYDPIAGTSPVRTLSNVDRVDLALGSHPFIIELPGGAASGGQAASPQPQPAPQQQAPQQQAPQPAPTPAASPPSGSVTVGSGANTLSLLVTEDAWQGDAQFTIAIDGQQIGGTQTTSATRSAGQAQLYNVKGEFGAGSHTATIRFINDAWGGTSTTDRNLFVSAAAFNGRIASGAALALYGNGPQSFGFTTTSGGGGTLELQSGRINSGSAVSLPSDEDRLQILLAPS